MRKSALLLVIFILIFYIFASSVQAEETLERCNNWYRCTGELLIHEDASGDQVYICADTVGFPINFENENFAMVRDQLDQNSDEHFLLDVDGEQIAGYSACRDEYDDSGNKISEEYLNSESELVLYPDSSYASWKAEYDADGNRIRMSYFGLSGEPTWYASTSVMAWGYDMTGRMTSVRYYDTECQPTPIDDYYSWQVDYDNKELSANNKTLGINDESVVSRTDTFSSYTWKYQPETYLITNESYFDENDQPVLTRDGYASIASEYDERGNLILETFFGTEGELVMNSAGFASRSMAYDPVGDQMSEERFDEKGAAVEFMDQPYVRWSTFSEDGDELMARHYYDRNGELVEPIMPLGYLDYEDYHYSVQINGYYGDGLDEVGIPRAIFGMPVQRIFNAFVDVPGLKSVKLPETLRNLDYHSFMNTGLEELIIPEGVDTLYRDAIRDNSELSYVSLPASLASLYGNPIIGVADEFKAELDEDNEYFVLQDGMLLNKDGTSLYAYWGNEKQLHIPDSVRVIEQYAFAKNQHIESVILPWGAEVIDNYAFMDCPNLKTVSVPPTVISISNSSFLGSDVEINSPEGSYAELYVERQYDSPHGEYAVMG